MGKKHKEQKKQNRRQVQELKAEQADKTNVPKWLPVLVGACAVLAAVLVGMLIWLLPAHKNVLTYDAETDRYIDENGKAYMYMGLSFEPVSYAKESDAYVQVGKTRSDLYRISGMTDGDWYCTDDGDVFGAIDAMPDIYALTVDEIGICQDTTIVTQLGVIAQRSNIEAIRMAFEDGETVNRPDVKSQTKYVLRFYLGDTYKGLIYKLEYLEYEEEVEVADGKKTRYFLYEREGEKCVPMDATVHDILENGE